MRDGMNEEVIGHIRERMATLRKIMGMAHDPRMIEMLEAMLVQAEDDIRKLEADSADAAQPQPAPPADPGPTPQS
jgi:predicted  nucleic acid-binding Zn-ribbon protein